MMKRYTTALVFLANNNKQKIVLYPQDPPGPNNVSRSLVLALSVCYHARLQDREDYEEGVAYQFTPPLNLPGGAQQFRNEIRWLAGKFRAQYCNVQN